MSREPDGSRTLRGTATSEPDYRSCNEAAVGSRHWSAHARYWQSRCSRARRPALSDDLHWTGAPYGAGLSTARHRSGWSTTFAGAGRHRHRECPLARTTGGRRVPANSPRRWSSRPRPPTCSRSSAARRATYSRCSMRYWRSRRPDLCEAQDSPSLRRQRGKRASNTSACITRRRHCVPTLAEYPARSSASKSSLGRTAVTKQVVQIDDVGKSVRPIARGIPLVVAGADLGGYRTRACGPDAQRRCSGRCHLHLPPRGSVRSPTSRSSLSKTFAPRPSSP